MNKKNPFRKKLICAFLVLLVTICLTTCYVLYQWDVFSGERDREYVSQFYYEQEDSMDGIVFGSSAAYRYWCPPEAFDRHGMAVYCYGIRSVPVFALKHYIASSLDTQSPEFIAIELRSISRNPEIYEINHVLTAVNRMPNTEDRTAVLIGFMEFDLEYETRISKDPGEYGFPENNGRAENAVAVIKEAGKYKGYIPYGIGEAKSYEPPVYSEEKDPIDQYYEEDLLELLDYCDTLDCEVIFMATPFIDDGERYRKINYAINIVEDRGYLAINMNDEAVAKAIGLDYSSDFHNSTHTNVKGAVKVTDYLSDIFHDMYDTPDHRGEKGYRAWEKAYEVFEKECK